MRRFGRLREEQGFTLHEVLVAIVVSSLLIGFGLSIFMFAQKFLMAHERMSDLKDAVDRALFVVSSDIAQSCLIKEISDSSLMLVVGNRRVITYRFDSLAVERNGVRMHDAFTTLRLTAAGQQGQSGQTVAMRALRIRISGERGGARYGAETVTLVPWSARQEFLRSVSWKR